MVHDNRLITAYGDKGEQGCNDNPPNVTLPKDNGPKVYRLLRFRLILAPLARNDVLVNLCGLVNAEAFEILC